jgi:hypothetical protein
MDGVLDDRIGLFGVAESAPRLRQVFGIFADGGKPLPRIGKGVVPGCSLRDQNVEMDH